MTNGGYVKKGPNPRGLRLTEISENSPTSDIRFPQQHHPLAIQTNHGNDVHLPTDNQYLRSELA